MIPEVSEAARIPTLAAVMSASLSKARSLTKSDMVKPIPARQPAPTTWVHVTPRRQPPLAAAHHQPAHESDPQRLAHDQPGDDPEGQRTGENLAEVPAQGHPGIGEGEKRQDEPDLNRVQGVLEHETRGQRVPGPDVDGLHRIELLPIGDDAAARLDLVLRLVEKGLGFEDELFRTDCRSHRNHHSEEDAGDGRVHSRGEDREPHHDHERQHDAPRFTRNRTTGTRIARKTTATARAPRWICSV